MQTMIVGAGAMGSLIGYLLHRAGANVSLVDSDPEVLRALTGAGLRVEGLSGAHTAAIPAFAAPPPQSRPDLILVLVKAFHTEAAAEMIKNSLGQRTVVLSLQHGVGHEEIFAAALGRERVLVGVTSLGASLLAPGHVLHASWGDTTVAPLDPVAQDQAQQVSSFFTRHGLKTGVAEDALGLIWGRVVIHCGIGAVAALTRVRNGRLLEIESARELMHSAIDEAKMVVEAAGIKLPFRDTHKQAVEFVQRTADSISAMLQDIYKGRPSEVEHLNGAIVRLAEKHGLEAPINYTLMQLIKAATPAG